MIYAPLSDGDATQAQLQNLLISVRPHDAKTHRRIETAFCIRFIEQGPYSTIIVYTPRCAWSPALCYDRPMGTRIYARISMYGEKKSDAYKSFTLPRSDPLRNDSVGHFVVLKNRFPESNRFGCLSVRNLSSVIGLQY